MMTVQCVVFALFLLIRLLSVYVVKTWYVPDEYWQSLEVAHRLTFGYGYLTWEWSKGIRNYMYPLSIAAVYRTLDWFGLDKVEYLVFAPRILQAILSAYSDYCFYRWSRNSKWSAFLVATSWFWFYTGSRTLLNTVETCLTTIALNAYSYRHKDSESTKFLWIVALMCFIRPTAAILWFPLCMIHIRNANHSIIELLFKRYLLIAVIVGSVGVAIDSYVYGRFIVTPYEFFKLNVLENVGGFYGTQPWYWYFVIGLPTVLGVYTLPFLIAVLQTLQNRDKYPDRYNLLVVILFTLVVYSCLTHKEFRFVLPLLPICLHITADTLKDWSQKTSGWAIWLVAFVLLVLNIIPAVYLSWTHQRGTIDIMQPIEHIAREYRDGDGHRAKFLFLMPCHSTPLYSHTHQNVTLRFLTCEPNFNDVEHYADEADQFYNNPTNWLQANVAIHPRSKWPTHIVTFDSLQPQIGAFLKNYRLIIAVYHTEFVDNRVGQIVLLYERLPMKPNESIKSNIPSTSTSSSTTNEDPKHDEF